MKLIESKVHFQALVNRLMRRYHLTPEEVSRKITMPTSTVLRYMNGVSAPHPLMRKGVIKAIIQLGRSK